MITKNDIKIGSKFQNQFGDVFRVDDVKEVVLPNKTYIAVESSYLSKYRDKHSIGNYRDTIDDFIDFLNEEKAFKIMGSGGNVNKIKYIIKTDDDDRTIISIKYIGQVVLSETYPEYEFLEEIGEEGLEELGLSEGDLIGKIEHLQVDDKFKGKGYAKLLMKKAIEVAKEKDLFPLYLNASPMGNKGLDINDLTNFYKSFGFEIFLEQGNNNLMILNKKYDMGGDIKDDFKFTFETEEDWWNATRNGYIPDYDIVRLVVRYSNGNEVDFPTKTREAYHNALKKIQENPNEKLVNQYQSFDYYDVQEYNDEGDYNPNEEYNNGGEIDLFDEWETLPIEVQEVLEKYQNEDEDYEVMRKMEKELNSLGYTFDYGLDAIPYNLRKMKKGGEVTEIKDAIEILESLGDDIDENIKEALGLLKNVYEEMNLPEPPKSIEDIIGENAYKKGGVMKRTKFKDKVNAIADRLEGTKVPKRLRKDYGVRYDKQEAQEAGRRIAGYIKKKYEN